MTKVITIGEQRFYPTETGDWYPSVTTILSATYPKSRFLLDWQLDKGKEEADRILKEAAEDGTFVHERVEQLIKGYTVNTEFLNAKQARCLMAFVDWAKKTKPDWTATEIKVYNHLLRYAGTIDVLCEINGEPWLIDIKTSNYIHDSYSAQVAAYAEAYSAHLVANKQFKAGILHLNARTKSGWSFKEIDILGGLSVFKNCLNLFNNLYPDACPKIFEIPDQLSLN